MYFRKERIRRQTYDTLAAGLPDRVIYFDFEMIFSGVSVCGRAEWCLFDSQLRSGHKTVCSLSFDMQAARSHCPYSTLSLSLSLSLSSGR
jgi:hypothetical protein